MSILIVEDNAINAKWLEHFLNTRGYQTIIAKNALMALATLSPVKEVQLIITDLHMPEMNGLDFIAKVGASSACQVLPIIVVSAQSDVATIRRAGGLECDDFLAKPIEKERLLKRVEQVLIKKPLV